MSCSVIEAGDDAAAVEVSLIENVAREDADELTCFETYVALIRTGRTVDDLARTFGKSEREITQCLALANLLPRIRELYRDEQLDISDLQLLTLATKTQQRDWLKLWDDNDPPTGHSLKAWLFGGKAIATKVALFDVATYPGKIVGDLFSEDGYFDSAETFWTAQDEAIATRRDAYLAAGWSEVVVLERGQHFPSWDFAKTAKKAGGKIFVEVAHNGEVRFHEGYVTQREANRTEAKAKGETVADKEPEVRSPFTAAMRNYLDLHRHAAVRLALVARPKDALRLLIAHAVASSGNCKVRPDAQRADNKAIAESLAGSAAQSAFDAEVKKVRSLLAPAFKKLERDAGNGFCGQGYDSAELTLAVFHRLLKLGDKEVARVAACVMAETLAVGSEVTDTFGQFAKVQTRSVWTPDSAFFDLMRDRASVNVMLAEVAGKKDADKLVSAKLKDQKVALADAAAKDSTWCPGWMRFPATDL